MTKVEMQNIIHRPIVTEKATDFKDHSKYVFKVDVRANKVQIAKAVESIYDVNVVKCNIINVRGKKKRVRYKVGMTSGFKKAIVTLKEGQSLPFFEGV